MDAERKWIALIRALESVEFKCPVVDWEDPDDLMSEERYCNGTVTLSWEWELNEPLSHHDNPYPAWSCSANPHHDEEIVDQYEPELLAQYRERQDLLRLAKKLDNDELS